MGYHNVNKFLEYGVNSSFEELQKIKFDNLALKNELDSKKSKIILCRINIKENTPALFYTNIMFYDNFNKTLPVGMNLSIEVLVDVNKLKLDFKGEETFYINHKENEFDFTTKEVKLYEYEVCNENNRKGIDYL